ncbi:MAG TPA: class I SAM-dependent methyltransferase, partial [Gemmatimonadaceae bacterium]|nr:class I SAM-dependent methyltransferase [Gemmatimonadaceae bacterium]
PGRPSESVKARYFEENNASFSTPQQVGTLMMPRNESTVPGGRTDRYSRIENDTKSWYRDYYQKYGTDRNDLLSNPEVLFQTFALDMANIRALRRLPVDRQIARVLDVGCGSGPGILSFIRLGFKPANLAGIDLIPERIDAARAGLPGVDFRSESADALSHPSDSFEIVYESGLFTAVMDESLAKGMADEMIRVAKPGSFIVLVDWRYRKPRNPNYAGLSLKRLRRLFEVGRRTTFVAQERGSLIPPLGRFLSRRAPSLYFVVQGLLPFAVGQTTTVIQKNRE